MLGYQDKAGTYLPPYNWWAESAAKHMVDEINKFYRGTGFQFTLQQVSRNDWAELRGCRLSTSCCCCCKRPWCCCGCVCVQSACAWFGCCSSYPCTAL